MPRVILIMGAFVLMSGAAGVAQAQDSAAPLPDSAAAASVGAKPASKKAAQSGGKSESSSVTNADPGNDPPSRDAAHDNSLGRRLFEHVILDQKAIWTSPSRIRVDDATWLVPLAGVTVGLFATDQSVMNALPKRGSIVTRSNSFSNYGLGAFAAVAGGSYLLGTWHHDDHMTETGILSAEAMLDSTIFVESVKYAVSRGAPDQNSGAGNFFQGGGGSFPSFHAAAAWSIAGIVAHEYPGRLTKVLAYGLATAVSLSRVSARQHFPSDVLVGSFSGWMISQQVYRSHHDPENGGGAWDGLFGMRFSENPRPQDRGTTSVPLDSWTYPVFDRLASLGYIVSAYEGLKPWTRTECARLTEEARDSLMSAQNDNPRVHDQAMEFLIALETEFSDEIRVMQGGRPSPFEVDEMYARVVSASGTVLTDGFHFGQTFGYDFGRPFRRGTNYVTGAAFRATAGPLFIYINPEIQHSPSAPALPLSAREIISERDILPIQPGVGSSAINQVSLLDAYVGINLGNFQISFGKQSLNWGPGPGGSALLSDNAVPMDMLRFSPVQPINLPGFLHFLGPVRIDTFVGRLKDISFPPRPWIFGQKISFKPFKDFEWSYGRTTILGGIGRPLNTREILDAYFGQVDITNSVPGDSRTSVDWTWRIPHVHDYLVFYGELEDDDDSIPLQNLTKPILRPGIYITHLPGLPKMDLDFEWTNSESPGTQHKNGQENYWNTNYRDGYRNGGDLMGNTVGRMGNSLQFWTTYWFSPRHSLQITAKDSRVYKNYLPGGAAWQDYRVSESVNLNSGFFFSGLVQYEHISHFPVLFPGVANNVTASVEIGFAPSWRHDRRRQAEAATQ
jgi:membrane-associated phospholipid phosphatase